MSTQKTNWLNGCWTDLCFCSRSRLFSEPWDKYDEPGFQPNANLNPISERTDESHRLISDPVGTVGLCYSHARNSSLAPGLSTAEGMQPTAESNSQNSSMGTLSNTDPSRRHLIMTGLSSSSGNAAMATHTSGGTIAATATSGTASVDNISSYAPSSASHSVISNQKSSTMAQLLASNNSTSSTGPVTTTSSSNGGSVFPPYDYHSMMPTDPHIRESEAHGSEWSTMVSSSSACPPTKLMKDAVGAAGTPISRSMPDYQSTNEQPSPSSRSTGHQIASSSASSSGNASADPFPAPSGATTTVTFFVCEVCASRYRSTAGLRYHYHSQHSGYSPKNPISASASRLVVPVGEERGIGGGLRGGRPRRNKGKLSEIIGWSVDDNHYVFRPLIVVKRIKSIDFLDMKFSGSIPSTTG